MAPLAYTEITRNGTLQKNETAPPKITIQSRSVGGKVLFSCPQGFVVEGSPEAVCQSTGEWSDAMPLCKGMNRTSGMNSSLPNLPMLMPMPNSGRNWNNNRRAQRKRGGGGSSTEHASIPIVNSNNNHHNNFHNNNNHHNNADSPSSSDGQTGLFPMRITRQ